MSFTPGKGTDRTQNCSDVSAPTTFWQHAPLLTAEFGAVQPALQPLQKVVCWIPGLCVGFLGCVLASVIPRFMLVVSFRPFSFTPPPFPPDFSCCGSARRWKAQERGDALDNSQNLLPVQGSPDQAEGPGSLLDESDGLPWRQCRRKDMCVLAKVPLAASWLLITSLFAPKLSVLTSWHTAHLRGQTAD